MGPVLFYFIRQLISFWQEAMNQAFFQRWAPPRCSGPSNKDGLYFRLVQIDGENDFVAAGPFLLSCQACTHGDFYFSFLDQRGLFLLVQGGSEHMGVYLGQSTSFTRGSVYVSFK